MAGERVIHIRNGNHPAKDGDFFTAFPAWFALTVFMPGNDPTSLGIDVSRIARAVPVFVVIQRNLGGHFFILRLGGFEEHLRAFHGMLFHHLIFFRGEFAGFFPDAVGHGQFTQVM